MKEENEVIIHLPYKLRKSLNADEIKAYFDKQRRITRWLFVFSFSLMVLVVIGFLIFETERLIFTVTITYILTTIMFYYSNKQYHFTEADISEAIEKYKKEKGLDGQREP